MKNDKNFVNLKGTLEKVDYSHQSGGKMSTKRTLIREEKAELLTEFQLLFQKAV